MPELILNICSQFKCKIYFQWHSTLKWLLWLHTCCWCYLMWLVIYIHSVLARWWLCLVWPTEKNGPPNHPPPQAAPKKGKEERKLYTFIAVQSVFSITFLFGCICSCALFTVTFVETYLWVFILWLTTIYRTFFNAGLLKSGACISLFMIVHHLKVLIFQS